MLIADLLNTGAEGARTSRELSKVIGCTPRELTKQIERERRAGQPICAAADNKNPGYYLAASDEELSEYCERLHHRAAEMYKTRQALLKILKGYAAKKETG